VPEIDWLLSAGRRPGSPRRAALEVNSIHAMMLTVRGGLGVASLPDYLAKDLEGLVRILPELNAPKTEAYFVYPEELRNSKRVAVFRDFLLARLAEL
jgi:DNA-binding transcriptional LysR family regulator